MVEDVPMKSVRALNGTYKPWIEFYSTYLSGEQMDMLNKIVESSVM